MERSKISNWRRHEVTEYMLRELDKTYPLNYVGASNWDEHCRIVGRQQIIDFLRNHDG